MEFAVTRVMHWIIEDFQYVEALIEYFYLFLFLFSDNDNMPQGAWAETEG